MKQEVRFIDRFYKPLTAVLVVLVLNFASAKLIDLLLLAFGGLPEMTCLVATLVTTVIVSAVSGVFLIRVLWKLYRRHMEKRDGLLSFDDLEGGEESACDAIPERKMARMRLLPRSGQVKQETAAGSNQAGKTQVCQCAAGSSQDMTGVMKLYLSNGEPAVISTMIVKRADGSGMLRTDCKIADQTQTSSFRMNYCPVCGGRYIKTEKEEEVRSLPDQP